MNNPNAKTIPVKGYLSPDSFLDLKSVFDPAGLSWSSAINLGLLKVAASLRQLDQSNGNRRRDGGRMPKTGPHRPWPVSNARRARGGAPKPFLRV